MNNLPKDIVYSFFESKEQYLKMKEAWKAEKNHTALQHFIYALIRGVDFKKAFTEVTNQNKLRNGGYYNWSFYKVFSKCNWFCTALCSNLCEGEKHYQFCYYLMAKNSFNSYNLSKCFNNTISLTLLRKIFKEYLKIESYHNKSYGVEYNAKQSISVAA